VAAAVTHPRGSLFALAAALAAGLVLLFTSGTGPGADEEAHLASQWPDARTVALPGTLDDGSVLQPLLVLDPGTWLATAREPGGRQVRLLLLRDGRPTEWRELPGGQNPQVGGATAADGTVAWVESTLPPDGAVVNRIWAAEPDGTPRQVTSDVGDVTLVNSGHDMVIADGRLYWTAAGATGDTELRSVPLTGGEVTVRELSGRWALSEWPWLTSAAGPTDEVRLRRVDTGEQIAVPVGDGEVVTCSPQWCRVLRPDAGEHRIALMRPDGSEHRTLAAPVTAMSPLVDVALAGRFEAWTVAGPRASGGDQRLMLYDLDRGESFEVATGVGRVMARGDHLWWSTGPTGSPTWHALDLTALD
jgi:hypothetical protein